MKKIVKKINWEKAGVYIAIITLIFYIVEMKVDIAKLQVKVQKLEENK